MVITHRKCFALGGWKHGFATGSAARRGRLPLRRLGDKAVFVAANLTGKPVEFKASVGETLVVPANGHQPGILMTEHGKLAADGTCSLGPWGYVVVDL